MFPLYYCSVDRFMFLVLTIYAHSGQKQPDNFDEMLQVKALLGKYLMEKCSSKHNQLLSFKYFVK